MRIFVCSFFAFAKTVSIYSTIPRDILRFVHIVFCAWIPWAETSFAHEIHVQKSCFGGLEIRREICSAQGIYSYQKFIHTFPHMESMQGFYALKLVLCKDSMHRNHFLVFAKSMDMNTFLKYFCNLLKKKLIQKILKSDPQMGSSMNKK